MREKPVVLSPQMKLEKLCNVMQVILWNFHQRFLASAVFGIFWATLCHLYKENWMKNILLWKMSIVYGPIVVMLQTVRLFQASISFHVHSGDSFARMVFDCVF